MTPEQLEAHRVRFEQHYLEKYQGVPGPEWFKENREYARNYETMWQAYQWALADSDRAQRAAPPQQSAQPVAWRTSKSVLLRLTRAASVPPSPFDPHNSKFPADHTWRTVLLSDLQELLAHAAAQPVEVQRVPLTDERMAELWVDALQEGFNVRGNLPPWDFGRAIEAAHGIKPTSSEGGAA